MHAGPGVGRERTGLDPINHDPHASRLHGVRIAGTGSYLPGPPISQDELRRGLRLRPDCLPTRVQDALLAESGIHTRHLGVSLDDFTVRESNTSMAVQAARNALSNAQWAPADVDLLVVTTVIPDQLIPPTSTLVQQALGIRNCAEIEISANCTASYKALQYAANQIRLGEARRVLVCSSQFVSFLGLPPWAVPEQMTASQAQLRWVLSDGAGAIALERSPGDEDIHLRVWLQSRANGRAPGMELRLGAAHPDLAFAIERGAHHVGQHARRLRTAAMQEGMGAFESMLAHFEVTAEMIDHAIPELPGMQYAEIARRAVEGLGLRERAWHVDLAAIGNVGGAAFPIVLDRLARGGKLEPGQLIASFAVESSNWMFAGLLLRWNSGAA
jgi:3-oxoacyl-[acyl-carrier-protein] synthase III